MRQGIFLYEHRNKVEKIKLPFIPVDVYEMKIFVADIPNTNIIKVKLGRGSYMETWNFLNETGTILIMMKRYKPEIIAHEFHHCVDMIYEFIMEPASYKGETRAYLFEYLLRVFNKHSHKLVLK